jgi:uroporphyrinogen-III synthase
MTLYLGLDPSNYPGAVHYPVIDTLPAAFDLSPKEYETYTHLIFTSKSAVAYWHRSLDGKIVIAIGPSTKKILQERGVTPLVAPFATQEGIIELLEGLDLKRGRILFPRSRLARSVLDEYLHREKIFFRTIDLYDTIFIRNEPVPDLSEFQEIVFTSPSTVEGFLRIYKKIPSEMKLTPIGPITQKRLEEVQA